MPWRIALLALVATVLATACGGSGESARGTGNLGATPGPSASGPGAVSATGPAGCSPSLSHAPGDSEGSIESGGLTRTYVLHVPPQYSGSARTPLVLLFDGFSLTAKFMAAYTRFGAVADEKGLIAVTPNGAGVPQHWNSQEAPTDTDDVAFVKDLLQKLDGQLCIDPLRTYAAGYSNGGGMAQRLACDMPGRIAAVGLVAATYLDCSTQAPVIAFHGTADPLVAFEGSSNPLERGGSYPPARKALSDWARNIGCDGLPVISRPSSEVELSTFQNCPRGDGEALLYTVLGGGHTWPGGAFPLDVVGKTTQQVNASVAMWDFFAAHPRR